MITPFQIYLISIADSLAIPFFIIVAASIIGSVICGIWWATRIADGYNTDDDDKIITKKARKSTLTLFLIAIVTSFVCVFIPDTKTLIAMYTIPPIVNNKEVQKLPENLVKFANDYLEKLDKKEESK